MSPKVLVLQMVALYRWQNVKGCAGLVKSISSVYCQIFFVYLLAFSSCLVPDNYFCISIAFPVIQTE